MTGGGAGGPAVIAAGGTGGHVFPALALARGLRAAGIEPVFVTDRRGVAVGGEARRGLEGVARHTVRSGRVAGRGPLGAAAGAAALAGGFMDARRLFRRLSPAVAVGFGGYASLPPVAAAASLRIPTIVHEANARPGRANRLLARWATAVAAGFPDTVARSEHTGVPVGEAFVAARARDYEPPSDDGPIRVLAVGGSQGARCLGRVTPRALAGLPEALRRRLRVDQQCRPEDAGEARAVYAGAGISARVRPFIDDVAPRLAAAHLAIARAGASTIAELTVVGRPAILVPYPFAADDHQTLNARALAAAGGGWTMAESAFDAAALRDRLARLFGEPDRLALAAAAARTLGLPDAVARLVALTRRVRDGAAA